MRQIACLLLLSLCACGGPVDDAASQDDLGSCAAGNGQSGDYEFEDDVCHHKKYPSNRDRTLSCPVTASAAAGYAPSSAGIHVDENALKGIVPPSLRATLVLIRRVNGEPVYKYLSNGTSQTAFQPWSSTKWMAAANGGANLRRQSNGKVGLTASTHGGLPLGDLITNIENYDTTHGFTSNGLARYFHDIGGRERADALIHGAWLNRPQSESFGGNYGFPTPGLGYTFHEQNGDAVSITPDTASGIPNHLSTLTMAEFLKRLAVNNDDPATRMPWLEDADLETLFYGATQSKNYVGRMGGMSADDAIYIQSAVNIAQVEQRSHGKWRIFSKLGFGSGEFVDNGYACFPVLDAAGRPVPDAGREFVLSVQLATGANSWPGRDALLESYYQAIVARVMDGRLK